MSNTGVTTNPGGVTWNSSLFQAETSQLVSGQTVTGVTYPTFVRTPTNDLQFAYRQGTSGNGSWFIYDYSGASHTWSNGHQIDDGTVGTYNGTTSNNSTWRTTIPTVSPTAPTACSTRPSPRAERPTARPTTTSSRLSDDGGNTLENNAGTVVGSKATDTKFTLNSPGLVVQPMPESQTLMNQQSQAVDSADHIHTLMWHRDSAKTASPDGVWDPQESSYFQYWRDDLGELASQKAARRGRHAAEDLLRQQRQRLRDLPGQPGQHAALQRKIYVLDGDLVIAAAARNPTGPTGRSSKPKPARSSAKRRPTPNCSSSPARSR